MKSFVFNVMLLNLRFYINNNEQSALTHSECQEREENSSWYDGLGPKWPQYSIQEKSKCSWQFILTHDRTSRQWRPRAPDLKKKKEINKQNNKKKTLDGQHKCYEIYEKSYFLYFIKKKGKVSLQPKIKHLFGRTGFVHTKITVINDCVAKRFLWSKQCCQRFNMKIAKGKRSTQYWK